jgi:hypothetical protein
MLPWNTTSGSFNPKGCIHHRKKKKYKNWESRMGQIDPHQQKLKNKNNLTHKLSLVQNTRYMRESPG